MAANLKEFIVKGNQAVLTYIDKKRKERNKRHTLKQQ